MVWMSLPDEIAPGLWRVTVIRSGLPPTMTAHALRDRQDAILVDPLVRAEGEPLLAALDGELRVWPRHRSLASEPGRTWYEQGFLPPFEPLTRLDVERVLVTHGEPVLRDGAARWARDWQAPVEQVVAVLISAGSGGHFPDPRA